MLEILTVKKQTNRIYVRWTTWTSYRYDNTSHLYNVTNVLLCIYKLQHNNGVSFLLNFQRECGIREQSMQDIEQSHHLRSNANISDFLWTTLQAVCQVLKYYSDANLYDYFTLCEQF